MSSIFHLGTYCPTIVLLPIALSSHFAHWLEPEIRRRNVGIGLCILAHVKCLPYFCACDTILYLLCALMFMPVLRSCVAPPHFHCDVSHMYLNAIEKCYFSPHFFPWRIYPHTATNQAVSVTDVEDWYCFSFKSLLKTELSNPNQR